MERYYLAHSAAFDIAPFIYHTDRYKEAIKAAGGVNVRTAYQFGWTNQPHVVTFGIEEGSETPEAPGEVTLSRQLRRIQDAIAKEPPFCTWESSLPCPLIRRKDW